MDRQLAEGLAQEKRRKIDFLTISQQGHQCVWYKERLGHSGLEDKNEFTLARFVLFPELSVLMEYHSLTGCAMRLFTAASFSFVT